MKKLIFSLILFVPFMNGMERPATASIGKRNRAEAFETIQRQRIITEKEFFEAVGTGDIGLVVAALAQNPLFIVRKTLDGMTALHKAAKYGHSDVIETLIGAGTEINARDKKGRTPLMLAAREKEIDAMVVLKKLGADESLVDTEGNTYHTFMQRTRKEKQKKEEKKKRKQILSKLRSL